MAKCGPKPKQISARQLRLLIREEQRAYRSATQPPPAPLSPCPKKRIYTRPSQHNVSLARKKQVKIKPRLTMVRRARTESSVAFSAITVEIPLFDVLKCAKNLVYMPQAPVPFVCPITPPRGTPAIGLDLGDRTELLETPRVVATSQPRLHLPPFHLEGNVNVSLSPASPDLQRTPTGDDPASFAYEDSAQVQVLSQLPMEQESDAVSFKVLLPKEPLSVDKCLERIIEQADSPETSYHRSLMASIWAQPTEPSLVRKQSDLRDTLRVDIISSTVQESMKAAEQPTQRNGLVSNAVSCLAGQAKFDALPRATRPEATLNLVANLNGGGSDGYGARRSSRTHTPGAFANTVLRQTGHLRKKIVIPPNGDRKAQDTFGNLSGQSLQSRSPTSMPYRSGLDGTKDDYSMRGARYTRCSTD